MIKRIISIILAVLMLGSVAVVAASAEESPAEKTYNYVALGDSIAAGYGLTAAGSALDPALVLSEDLIADPVKDAYAQVFGDRLAEIGAEYGYTTTATNLSATAYRAEDIAQLITTEGYQGVVAKFIFEAFVGKGSSDLLLPYHDIYAKYLPEADLVSIQLGGNDIVMGVIYPMIELDNPILNDTATALALVLFGLSPTEAIGAGAQMLIRDKDKITPQHIAEAIKYFAGVKENAEQYVINSANYVNSVVDTVKEVNPTADIALVGMYNPYGNSLMYDGQVRDICNVLQNMFIKAVDEAIDIEISIGAPASAEETEGGFEDLDSIADELFKMYMDKDALRELQKQRIKALITIAAEELAYPIQYLTAGKNVDPQMKLLNQLLQEIAEKQGVTYVDVYDISNECNTDPHPTAAGHKEIADRLEAAVMDLIIAKMSAAAPAAAIGDIDGDGKVDIFDASKLQRNIASGAVDYSKLDANDPVFKAADIDGDGKVDIFDVSLLQRWIAGDKSVEKYFVE